MELRSGHDYEPLEGAALQTLLMAIDKERKEKLVFVKGPRSGYLYVGPKDGFTESWLLDGDLIPAQ